MTAKTVLYLFITPLVIWALESINITNVFKKNRYYQARALYLILSLSLSYLTVNFIYDFFMYSKII
ncbi:MAG: DUF1146 domain-containing protein [Bacilli bacterium]|nr:DUF1146 domain-containing protein [Bacilli bacterium]